MPPRPVTIEVTSTQTGQGLVVAYDHEGGRDNSGAKYEVPLYRMNVSGTDASGARVTRSFDVIRFGVLNRKGRHSVVGLADRQTHRARRANYDGGSWQIYGNFLIHDGANNPQTQAWGAIGCIEVTGMASGGRGDAWLEFERLILNLSGTNDHNAITRARSVTINIEATTRPPLVPVVPDD